MYIGYSQCLSVQNNVTRVTHFREFIEFI